MLPEITEKQAGNLLTAALLGMCPDTAEMSNIIAVDAVSEHPLHVQPPSPLEGAAFVRAFAQLGNGRIPQPDRRSRG